MIGAVVALLVFTLIFLPIRIGARVKIVPSSRSAFFEIRLFGIMIMKQKVVVDVGKLTFYGTINTVLYLRDFDPSAGIAVYKCFTPDSIRAKLCLNLVTISPATFVGYMTAFRLAATISVALANVGISAQELPTTEDTNLQAVVLLRFCVGELLFCTIKEGVKKWITRKSAK